MHEPRTLRAARCNPRPVSASEWVAAGAALAAAGVVAWQSWETRRSANASVQAVGAAERAVEAANAGLELSRHQFAEAVRARIDAATPQIVVLAPEFPHWPPSVQWDPVRQPGDPRDEFYLPQDGRTTIGVRAEVTIVNDSRTTADVQTLELFDENGNTGTIHHTLGPGQRVTMTMLAARTVADWVAIYRQREGGDGGPLTGGTVLYLDPADTGATDRWEVTVGGCPLEPVPGRDGAWRVIDRPDDMSGRPGAMRMAATIRERTYWLSKRSNTRLEP